MSDDEQQPLTYHHKAVQTDFSLQKDADIVTPNDIAVFTMRMAQAGLNREHASSHILQALATLPATLQADTKGRLTAQDNIPLPDPIPPAEALSTPCLKNDTTLACYPQHTSKLEQHSTTDATSISSSDYSIIVWTIITTHASTTNTNHRLNRDSHLGNWQIHELYNLKSDTKSRPAWKIIAKKVDHTIVERQQKWNEIRHTFPTHGLNTDDNVHNSEGASSHFFDHSATDTQQSAIASR